MQLQNNFFIHAVAGSGKTTRLIKLALRFKNNKILITTYTNKNTEEIKKKIISIIGYLPQNIEVKTWFGFLLSDCIRPYQRVLGFYNRIKDILFTVKKKKNKKLPNGKIITVAKRSDVERYYFNKENKMYSCMLSDFACNCNENSNGAVIKRIEKCYDYIFIDEAQDFSGWDFTFLDLLFASKTRIIVVGDKRQNLFDTHKSNKNRKYAEDLSLYFKERQQNHIGILKEMNRSRRCCQRICNFSDKINPELVHTISDNTTIRDHMGIFYVRKNQVNTYIEKYNPQVLVWDKRNKLSKIYKTLNLGESKGLTFERVLISPTNEIVDYLKNGNFKKESIVIKNKLYVGITRAKYSVAFIIDDDEDISQYSFEEIALWQSNF